MPSTIHVLCASVLFSGLLAAQPREFPQYPPAREASVTAISGVVDAGVKWKMVWQGDQTADGLAASPDGGLLFAQEQSNHIDKLDKNGKFSVFLSNPHGPGAVAIGPKGQILVVERTCTDPGGHLGVKPADCKEPTDVAVLTPERRVLADSVDGKSLGRVNDLEVDRKGGVYFTSGGAFYLSPAGKVSAIGEDLRTNGIVLSPDEKTLYITNRATIAAFDVQPDGSVKNQREFAKLGGGGDGMTVDSVGRIYVTTPGQFAIEVFSPQGQKLGVIPTPREPISVAFSGPGKKTLYAACMGSVGPDGKDVRTPPGVRNVAMTVYTIPMRTKGLKSRSK